MSLDSIFLGLSLMKNNFIPDFPFFACVFYFGGLDLITGVGPGAYFSPMMFLVWVFSA